MEQPNTQAMMAEGVAAAKSGNRELARKHFFEIIATDPQCFDVWLWLGGIADDPSESVAYLSHALEMRPDSVKAQKGMAWAQQKLSGIEAGSGGGLLETAATAAATPPPATLKEPDLPKPRTSETDSLAVPSPVESPASLYYRPAAQGDSEPALGPLLTSEPAHDRDMTGDVQLAESSPAVAADPSIDLDSWSNLLQEQGAPTIGLNVEVSSSVSEAPFGLSLGSSETPNAAESGADLDWDAILNRLKSYDGSESEVASPAPDPARANLDGLFAQLSEPSGAQNTLRFDVPPSSGEQEPPSKDPLPMITFDAPPLDNRSEAPPPLAISFDAGSPTQAAAERQAASGAADLDFFAAKSFEPQTQTADSGLEAWFAAPAAPNNPTGMESVSTWLDDAAKPMNKDQAEVVNSWLDNLTAQQTAPLSEVLAQMTTIVGQGKQAMEAGNLAEAIVKFQEALQINPNSLEAREQLGIALYQTGKDAEAAREFEAITRMKPDHAEAYANLGFILTEQGKGEEAIDNFVEALKHDDSLLEARLGLAELYQKLGRLADAVTEWQTVNSLRPDLNEVHKSLGDAYVTLGRIEEGVLEYRIILERDPRNAYAHLKLGQVFIRMDRLPEAVTQFEKSISIDESVAEAHYGLGVCLAEQGQRSKAIEHLERALALRHDYPEASASLDSVMRQPEGTAGTSSQPAPGGDEGKKRHGIFKWGRK